MTELRYKSETTIDANDEQMCKELIDALRQAVLDEETEMETGRLFFDGDEIRVRYELRMETTIEDASKDKDELEQKVLDLDLERDAETAGDKIRL